MSHQTLVWEILVQLEEPPRVTLSPELPGRAGGQSLNREDKGGKKREKNEVEREDPGVAESVTQIYLQRQGLRGWGGERGRKEGERALM